MGLTSFRRRRPVWLPAPFVVAVVALAAALAVAVASAEAAQPEGCRLEITVSQRMTDRDELWVTVRSEGHRSEPVRVGFGRAAWVGVGNCGLEITVWESVNTGVVYLGSRGWDGPSEALRLVLGDVTPDGEYRYGTQQWVVVPPALDTDAAVADDRANACDQFFGLLRLFVPIPEWLAAAICSLFVVL